jgi:hypothetical protein
MLRLPKDKKISQTRKKRQRQEPGEILARRDWVRGD